jgi:hypothetical protein
MATNTYVAIDTKTITSTVQAVTFTSIPQTYTDLVLVASPKCDGTRDLQIRVGNGTLDTGSNYSATAIWANNANTTGSNRNSSATYMYSNYYAGATATEGENVRTYHFNNYSNTNKFKSVLSRSSTASLGVDLLVGTWRSSSAINTLSMFPLSGDIVAGSTFTLYGIANSNIGAPKAFGGTITQDATYTYHAFGASGTFTPQQSLTADVLVIAGGGGGGKNIAGGGGAGGLVYNASQSFASATAYTATVGSGGSGSVSNNSQGVSGGNSSLTGGSLSLTAAVGGGGGGSGPGSGSYKNGLTGGSGGGGNGDQSGIGGSPTTSQGFAGGDGAGVAFPNYGGGGGGGSGAVGSVGTAFAGGAGGLGVNTYSSWAVTTGTGFNGYYAGGGGGGTNGGGTPGVGNAGGGNGTTNDTAATNALALTGSGGGGGGRTVGSSGAPGGNGAGGIIIIRYAN